MKFTLICAALLMVSISYGSIPKSSLQLEKILAEPSSQKFSQLRQMGPHIYVELRRLAFNDESTLGLRWQAFMALVQLGEKESLPEVQTALESPDWFMRDAALRVLPALDRERAYRAGVEKLHDSALVVRSSAVDVLAKMKNPNCSEDLWKELYSKENYIRHQSLWIRKHIVEALAQLAPKGSESKFVKILDDSDSRLFAPAIRGLERVTGKKLGAENVPPVYRRYYWKKWYQEHIKTAAIRYPVSN
jgi:HEAT repeat protein